MVKFVNESYNKEAIIQSGISGESPPLYASYAYEIEDAFCDTYNRTQSAKYYPKAVLDSIDFAMDEISRATGTRLTAVEYTSRDFTLSGTKPARGEVPIERAVLMAHKFYNELLPEAVSTGYSYEGRTNINIDTEKARELLDTVNNPAKFKEAFVAEFGGRDNVHYMYGVDINGKRHEFYELPSGTTPSDLEEYLKDGKYQTPPTARKSRGETPFPDNLQNLADSLGSRDKAELSNLIGSIAACIKEGRFGDIEFEIRDSMERNVPGASKAFEINDRVNDGIDSVIDNLKTRVGELANKFGDKGPIQLNLNSPPTTPSVPNQSEGKRIAGR